jgi:hypothetical protein
MTTRKKQDVTEMKVAKVRIFLILLDRHKTISKNEELAIGLDNSVSFKIKLVCG